jgi:hypothetical protein
MNRTVILLALLLAASCQRQDAGGPFEVQGKLVVFNYRMAYAAYVVTLARLRPIDEGLQLVARFENPKGGPMLEARRPLHPTQDRISVESPHIVCVAKDRPYALTIEIADADGRPVQTLKTTVSSSIDDSALPAEPLFIGPAYHRNPAAYDASGATILRGRTGCPS